MLDSHTIAVAMSGGVDSSTVAAMLRAEGHTVVGLTMQLWNQRRLAGHPGMPEAVQGRCCSLDDVYDARRVAETLGFPGSGEAANGVGGTPTVRKKFSRLLKERGKLASTSLTPLKSTAVVNQRS